MNKHIKSSNIPAYLRLGLNIDHVATLRNARGDLHPDPIKAAHICAQAGVDLITAHLREDRRHIRDIDIERIKKEVDLPLNMEMAATEEMLKIAINNKPYICCIVPENRAEITTEGGLDILGDIEKHRDIIKQLSDNGIKTSMFIDADEKQIEASAEIKADAIEIHTGNYCNAYHNGNIKLHEKELKQTKKCSEYAKSLGLQVHAGHGLCYDTVGKISAIKEIEELNIGHYIIGEAVFSGLDSAIRKMRSIMDFERSKI